MSELGHAFTSVCMNQASSTNSTIDDTLITKSNTQPLAVRYTGQAPAFSPRGESRSAVHDSLFLQELRYDSPH